MYFDEVDGSRQVTIRSPAQRQGELAPARLEEEGRLHFVVLENEDLSVMVVEDSDNLFLRCEELSNETLLDAPSTYRTRSTLPNSSARLTENWRQSKAAPDYSIRLRLLAESETKDCPEQTHAVEVRWTSSPLVRQGPVYDYSKSLFAALDSPQQESYHEELERFQSRGWWEPLHEDGVDGKGGVALPEAIAFPVVQGVKVRPCIDLRRGNAISPPSSYPGDSCAVILAQVRVAIAAIARAARQRQKEGAKPERLSFCTLDAATAFYRIRLHDRTAVIRSLGRRFVARRLVFGLRCGPAVLREALTCLIDDAMLRVSSEINDPLLLHWEYVDDICLLGGHQAVQRLKSEIICLGGSWGFEFTPAKCHLLTFSSEGQVERFDSFRHLGVDFTYREDHPTGQGTLVLRCVTDSDPHSQTFREGQRVCKRSLFRAAGAAFDPLGLHGDRGLAADYIRRVSGKWKAGWDQDVPLGKDEAKTLTIAIGILSARSRDCDHEVSFVADTLEVACDASPFGIGFIATLSSGSSSRVALSSRARALRGPMLNWHQNRKEAYGLAAAHVFADALVPYLNGLGLKFLSDSRTALSWLRGGSKLTCKSVDRLAISRLCEAIADVREAWQRKYMLTPELLHIPAEQNSESDSLSRLAFSWGIPDSIIFEGRGVMHTKAVAVFDEDGGSGSSEDYPTVCDVENQLRVIATVHPASQGVLEFGMEHGRPSRQRLLALQWASPTANFILRSLGSSPPPDVAPVGPATAPIPGVAAELPDFSLADDGLLMKRSQTPKVNGVSATRTCYYVPTDTSEGKQHAHSIVDAYHRETGCLNRRYIRWLVSRCFHIPRLRSFIEVVCGTCEGCRLSSNRRFYSTTDSARSLRTGVQECWYTVSADLAEMGWDRKRRLCAVLVLTCHFSGFTVVSPLKDQKSATVATEMASLFDLLGAPALLRTDGGPCFRGRPLAEMLSLRAVEHRVVSPYAPFSNGLAERAVASVKFLARQLGDKKTWPTTLGKVIRRLNCKPFLDTDLSPFEIFYGRVSRLSPENSLAQGAVDGGAPVARAEVRDEITKLVKAAIAAREQVLSDVRGLRRKGPPPVGSTVVLFNPDTLGRGGRYAPDVYRVHEIVRGVVLRLVNASIPPDEVTSQLIKETHYANVRPCNLPSGGHVE
ncbi:gag/pol/env polyprotein, putative [Perkinsus marinus ATCC 50983]|uniref:Gag/pol/env polyprotein, putative n=1 Tax=Perkinsus marinus (strain ATCC 50983 / TXsc) TaxID=423536 RepID=C5LJF3_PERM5|nr:gag/pol/env polyprotein, putative [Perkinsus marinus ATCC 50983]EER03153.1 gag/pol/env polyprotein, putative [Perkinsus marinus ATCC 50983]|eukprot:XP_002771337.1 gag/pol/env polyprotein, putative [Perkinsus marinus ATCC 50983]